MTGVYVVCLDCGQKLPYSWDEMKVVSPFEQNEASPHDDVPELTTKAAEELRFWMRIMPLPHVKAVPKTALLCIDDDQDVLECEKAFLEAFGYTVVTASSGREGLELAGLRSFDVVIVDYCMPGMNGQEFAIAMRRLRPLAPIILLSGMADVPGQALKVVDAFVPKDRLSSRLVPAIALLCGADSLPLTSFPEGGRNRVT